MTTKAQEMLAEVERLNTEVKTIFDVAGDGDLDAQTWEKVKANNKEIERLEGLVKEAQDRAQDAAQMRQQAQARQEQFKQPVSRPGLGGAVDAHVKQVGVGAHVLNDPQFKAWRDSLMVGGAVTSAKFGHSPRVAVPGGMKALLTGTSATSAGALVDGQFIGLQDMGAFMRPLTIRDIITTGQTGADVVDYVRVSGYTNAAAPVAEATATSGSSGAKPESALTMEIISEPVKTIAHWIPATRRALADAGQLRTIVDSFLRYGLDEELEDQILTGSGSGENFTGILNVSGTQAQPFATDLLTTTRQARTKVRVGGDAAPTAYVMHPNDWEDLDLLQDNEARYYFGGPSVLGSPRLWGLPVVESEGMTEGVSVCADWRLAVLWDREAANILVSDSHSDFFVRNMLAVLAELRAAFGVLRPSAFVEIDLTP